MWVLMSDYEASLPLSDVNTPSQFGYFHKNLGGVADFSECLVSKFNVSSRHGTHAFEGGGGCIQSCDVNALTWPFANELISWAMVTGQKNSGELQVLWEVDLTM